ncbi:MAG TPA: hypothetical protein V6C99_07745 [Oculatellaceae cyanobacterium]|jgi:hypothetical protein
MRTSWKIFWLFCLFLAIAGWLVVSALWSANSFFTGAYRPVVEKSANLHRNQNRIRSGDEAHQPSREPRPAGMRESDIKKEYGNRYATY